MAISRTYLSYTLIYIYIHQLMFLMLPFCYNLVWQPMLWYNQVCYILLACIFLVCQIYKLCQAKMICLPYLWFKSRIVRIKLRYSHAERRIEQRTRNNDSICLMYTQGLTQWRIFCRQHFLVYLNDFFCILFHSLCHMSKLVHVIHINKRPSHKFTNKW